LYVACVARRTVGQNLNYGVIGEADRTTTAGANYAGVAFLLREPFKVNATVFAFRVCYRNPNAVRLQIWRPTAAADNSYRLIGEVIHKSESKPESLPTLEEVSLMRFAQTANSVLHIAQFKQILTIELWIQRITFAAETRGEHTHSVTA